MLNEKEALKGQGRPIESLLRETPLRHLGAPAPPIAALGTPAGDIVLRMREAGAGAALVVDGNGRLAGIFTERDHLDKLVLADVMTQTGLGPQSPIESVMTPSPCTLSPDAKVGDAIRLMTEGGYRHIPLVEEDGRTRGLVSARDVVRFIADHFPTEVYNLPPGFRQRIRTCEGG